ncbi:MAG: protein translocase subunit SecF [Firmicutes bacterium]|nr:protein translocase subunit SecF [Bacillota bacterium]
MAVARGAQAPLPPAPYHFDFMRHRRVWFGIAVGLLVLSLASLLLQGFNLGLDYTGGTQIQLAFAHGAPAAGRLRAALAAAGIGKYSYVGSGAHGAFLTLPALSEPRYLDVVRRLAAAVPGLRVVQHNTVGAAVASAIVTGGIKAVLAAAVLIVLYMVIRFDLRYALTGIAAVFWDAVVTMGIVSLLRIEITSAFIAGILTIFGYSLNDRIIIFDRVRENMQSRRRGESLGELVNRSLNQTLTRSIITAVIVVVAMLTVLVLGGASTRDLAATVVIGVVFGAFSSILFATPLWYSWVARDEAAGRTSPSGGGSAGGRTPRRGGARGPRRPSDDEARGIRI